MAIAPSAWGLDVGITSLKAMKLRKEGDKVAVEAFDVVEHDKFLSEPDVDRDELIRATLRRFLDRNPIKNESVFVGVPGSSTFARFVKLPPVQPNKVPEIVRFEAIQQIPFPLDQVNWDYQTFTSPDSPEVEVGIFAMKKDLVGQVLSNFRSVGLTVTGVQMSPLAVYNAAAYDGLTDGKGSVLIDMGAEHTDLVIMDQGRLWLRTINIGGNHFTDALAKSFKQPFSRAESLKKTAATSKYQKQIFQAMRPIFSDLVGEIQRSIGYYNSSHRDSKLERIVGMGNPFKLPNLQKYLQQELKMEVVRLDGFRKLEADGKQAAALNDQILSMTSAYGLGVQGLGMAAIDTNLLPIEIARQMMWRAKRPWFIATAALLVAAAGVWTFQPWNAGNAYAAADVPGPDGQSQRAKNTSAIAEATRLNTQWAHLDTNYNQYKGGVDEFLKLADDRAVWPWITQDIWNALPQAKRQGAGPSIVITAIDSQYTDHLTASQADVSGGGGAAPAAPMGPWGGGGGFRGGALAPGGSRDRERYGGGQPQQVFPGPSAVVTSEATGPAKSGDRGFLVVISGYVSGAPKDVDSSRNVFDYGTALVGLAPKGGKKLYYFERGAISGELITQGGTGMAAGAIWGVNKGIFFDVFAPAITGIQPPELVGGGMAPAVQGPVDLFAPKAAGSGERPLMYGEFNFKLTMKAYINDGD